MDYFTIPSQSPQKTGRDVQVDDLEQSCTQQFGSASSSYEKSPVSQVETPITDPVCYGEPSDLDINDESAKYIMVTGGLGYIGSHTSLELLNAGYNVIIVDNLNNSHEKVLNTITQLAKEHCDASNSELPQLKFYEMDYQNPAMREILASYATKPQVEGGNARGILTTSSISAVIHLAAYKSVEESISKPLDYYQNNVCGLVDFLAVLQDYNIRNFVFSSSATVYGDKALRGIPLQEEDLVHHPTNFKNVDGQTHLLLPGSIGLTSPYGRTKSFAESILADLAYADAQWKILALRYFNPVGCHPSGRLGEDPRSNTPTNLFPVLGRVLTGKSEKLNIFGNDWDTKDGTAVRDFIHIQDLAKGHVAAMAASCKGSIKESFRAYNLGTGQGASVQEVVVAVQQATRRDVPVNHAPRRAGDVGYCVAATARVERELGWKATIPLNECARDMWNFLSRTKMYE